MFNARLTRHPLHHNSHRGLGWLTGIIIGSTAVFAAEPALPTATDWENSPIYQVGEVPFLTAWEGRDVLIRVRATELGAGTPVEAGFTQPPSGLITHTNGDFFYRAGPLDKSEFAVRFFALNGAGQAAEQTILVQPIPNLPPEGDLLGVERKGVPDPESRDYLTIAEIKEPKQKFNYLERTTRVVTISGKTVVFRAGHAGRLHDIYHDNEDLRELHINAERLIIGSPLRLKGTTVRIRARTLEFQDFGGVVSTLSTEPAALTIASTNRDVPGQDGLRGGDIEVFVETLQLPTNTPALTQRFWPKGGAGQDAAPGRKGKDGPDLKPVDVAHFNNNNPDDVVSTTARQRTTGMALDGDQNNRYDVYAGRASGGEITLADDITLSTVNDRYVEGAAWTASGAAGNGRWKPDGENAVPSGRSGSGGAGGRIVSNLENMLRLAHLEGGPPGKSEGYPGGAAGTPSPAYFYRAYDERIGFGEIRRFVRLATHTAGAGRNAAGNPGSFGPEGTTVLTNAGFAWLTAPALRQVLAHTKDAYLDGEVDFVAQVSTDYLGLLSAFREDSGWESVTEMSRLDLEQIEEELQLMAHRTASGLDYFGNPPGWVPLLSLEANKLAFEQEIGRAINLLYLEYWLSDATRTLQAKVGALAESRVQLADDSQDLADKFADANNLLPTLTAEATRIQGEVRRVQTSLKFLEETLINRAKENVEERNKVPWWKRAARGLGTICKFVPVPWVQAVGAGLNIVANFNASDPWSSLGEIADVAGTYLGGGYEEAARQTRDAYRQIRFPDLPGSANPEEINDYLKDLKRAAGPLKDNYKQMQQALRGTSAPRNQIEAELAKLKAESPEFRSHVDEVAKLVAQRELFARQVSQTMQSLGRMSENITGNLLTMDALNVDFAQAVGALDDRALMYLSEMGRRARERLLLYHYYVKKSYEYRLLKPYPTRLTLQNLFDRFRTIAETAAQTEGTNTFHRLTAAEFGQLRGIYDDALGGVVKEVIVQYNNTPPPLLAPRLIGLSPEEVAQLNLGNSVSLDLRTLGGAGLFSPDEENVRIANIVVKQLEYEPRGIAAQPADELTLEISHAGESTLWTSTGDRPRAYQFVHYSEATQRPVEWQTRLFPWNDELVQIVRSPSADSLLAALLNLAGTDLQRAGLFTQLGGLCTLNVRLKTRGAGLRLKNAIIEVSYEFVPRRSSTRSLEFATSDGVPAYIELSRGDLGGRRDGLGTFRREFTTGTEVTFSAPERVGNLRFEGFFEAPHGAQAQRARAVLTAGNRSQPARNVLPAQTDGQQHSVTLTVNQDRRIEARYVPVAPLELRIGEAGSEAEVPLFVDGERNTLYRLEQADSVAGPWEALEEGLILEPRRFPADSSAKPQQFFRVVPNP